ncbi:hypothetical protein [Nostoc sp. MG11]|uniref:hypothetical protein n=1 Tax=Nostoc sp. MG11 TaxID=2721166 RepID=UPI0018660BEA|nr:hypothetical protein [Nostoc sp. MG11]
MVMVVDNYIERTSTKLLHTLSRSGGSILLHRIQFSETIIQYLLDMKYAQIQNIGQGFLLEIAKDF